VIWNCAKHLQQRGQVFGNQFEKLSVWHTRGRGLERQVKVKQTKGLHFLSCKYWRHLSVRAFFQRLDEYQLNRIMLHEFRPLLRNAFEEDQDRGRCTFGRTENRSLSNDLIKIR
jgi:hypothetical protein